MSGEGPTARFGPATEAVAEALDRAQANDVARRLWAADLSLWTQNPLVQNQIADSLGWLRVAEAMRAGVDDLTAWSAEIAEQVDDVILLGMGGSSLAPEVMASVIPQADGSPNSPSSTPPTQPPSAASSPALTSPGRSSSLPASPAAPWKPPPSPNTSGRATPPPALSRPVATSSPSPIPAPAWPRSRRTTPMPASSSTRPTLAAATPPCPSSDSSPRHSPALTLNRCSTAPSPPGKPPPPTPRSTPTPRSPSA